MKKYLEDKIKVMTNSEAVELFKTEFNVELDNYNSHDLQYNSYETENYEVQSEIAGEGGEGEGDSIWTVSRIVDKKTGEVFFIRFDGYYESWNGSDWPNNDWSIVKPRQRIKGIIEDGYFILDIDYVNTISKLCYLKSLNKIENANRKDKKL